jgi:hypothetical protein
MDIQKGLSSDVFWVGNAFSLQGPTSSTDSHADKVAQGIAFSDTRLAKPKAVPRRLRHRFVHLDHGAFCLLLRKFLFCQCSLAGEGGGEGVSI